MSDQALLPRVQPAVAYPAVHEFAIASVTATAIADQTSIPFAAVMSGFDRIAQERMILILILVAVAHARMDFRAFAGAEPHQAFLVVGVNTINFPEIDGFRYPRIGDCCVDGRHSPNRGNPKSIVSADRISTVRLLEVDHMRPSSLKDSRVGIETAGLAVEAPPPKDSNAHA